VADSDEDRNPVKSRDAVTYASPPERVWAMLADWPRYPEWMPDVASVRSLGAERQLGLRLLVRTRILGVPAVNDLIEVTAWDPPRRMAIRHTGLVTGAAEWRLDPVPMGTRFVWEEDVRLEFLTMFPWVGEAALRAYWPYQRRMFRRSMESLRRLLDAPRS